MDRKSFLGSFAFGAASAAAVSSEGKVRAGVEVDKSGLSALGSNLIIPDSATQGIRRLTSDKNFTLFRAGIEPNYRVKPGEMVLVETQHGLPGRVTRDGTFRKEKPGDKVNPMTGPIWVEDIRPGTPWRSIFWRSGWETGATPGEGFSSWWTVTRFSTTS